MAHKYRYTVVGASWASPEGKTYASYKTADAENKKRAYGSLRTVYAERDGVAPFVSIDEFRVRLQLKKRFPKPVRLAFFIGFVMGATFPCHRWSQLNPWCDGQREQLVFKAIEWGTIKARKGLAKGSNGR